MANPASSSSGLRKYSNIWNKLKQPPHTCKVTTTHADYETVLNGVKKEKVRHKAIAKFKRLRITTVEIPATELGQPSTIEITFKLVDEVSINTI